MLIKLAQTIFKQYQTAKPSNGKAIKPQRFARLQHQQPYWHPRRWTTRKNAHFSSCKLALADVHLRKIQSIFCWATGNAIYAGRFQRF